DLFARAGANVPDDHVTGQAIEGEAERVPEPQAPDLRRGAPGERVVPRNAVHTLPDPVRVDQEDLAESVAQRLRVRAVARLPHRGVEQAVLAELQLSAVVVAGAAVGDRHHGPPARRVGNVPIGAHVKFVDVYVPQETARVRSIAGVEDVEEAVARVI